MTSWTRLHTRMWGTASKLLGRVPVVAGVITTTGIFDEKSELVLDENVVSVENALTVLYSELGHLRYGDGITVNGIGYRVRHEPMRMADGLLCVISLERLTGDTPVEFVFNGDFE